VFATPIIFVFFNRPEVTRRTFAAIRALQPRRLYLIADGPRASRPTDAARCAETRAVVEGMIDWKCEVTRDYAETNLGCGRRLSSGLTSAFATLGEAIVLEDDIFPHPDFFPFCASMLARHRDDPHVHSISGFNPLGKYAPSRGQAVPTLFNWIWGWASWQRSWKDYRYDIAPSWTEPATRQAIRSYVNNDLNFDWHARNFDTLVKDHVDTWDFQWSFTLLAQQRVTLSSSVNLIENLGFDAHATHTTKQELYLENLPTYPIVNTPTERLTASPDPLHDKLFGEVLVSGSRLRIALARLLARSPALARLWFKPAR
jgi:hypothetical protein